MRLLKLAMVLVAMLGASSAAAQQAAEDTGDQGPTQDVTYHVLWLIESDDVHRTAYAGPAREGLTAAGYGRLVPAGAAIASSSIGQGSSVTGASRYGALSVLTSMLNTTASDELQIKIELQTKTQSPVSINTAMRIPLGRWFLVGAAESRVGLPQHADDGKRGVVIMKVDDGVMLLD